MPFESIEDVEDFRLGVIQQLILAIIAVHSFSLERNIEYGAIITLYFFQLKVRENILNFCFT